jgi:hypothetical protein
VPFTDSKEDCVSEGELFCAGNAITDGKQGWFIGQFVPITAGLRHQDDVELKWGIHPKGETRPLGFAQYKTATTISILLGGLFRTWLQLDGALQEVTLRSPGDYIVFGPGVMHDWEALEDCVILTVRFPSIAAERVDAVKGELPG